MEVVVSRRTRQPARPFTHGERHALSVGALFVYMFAAVCTVGRVPSFISSALGDAAFWLWVVCYFPFTALFLRAAHRVMSPLLRLEGPKVEIEESPSELAAWASSTLDKKRKP